jgi:Fur family zinc uptake transcriptional regulator
MLSDAPFANEHNHTLCMREALNNAVQLCLQRGVRLTPLRQHVLELVWRSHKPLGAYTILENLQIDQGRRAAPPTVYRALDFLLEQGLIHRIASLNAFIGCLHPESTHVGQFFICEQCENAIELDTTDITESILQHANRLGFCVKNQTIEISGRCAHCQGQQSV